MRSKKPQTHRNPVRDTDSGLDNFGASYDASTMGRFMSPGPFGGKLVDPQTLNKYGFCLRNPTPIRLPNKLLQHIALSLKFVFLEAVSGKPESGLSGQD